MKGEAGSAAMEVEKAGGKAMAAHLISLFLLLFLSLTGLLLLPNWGPLEGYRAPLAARELYLQQVLILHALVGLITIPPILLYVRKHILLKKELSDDTVLYRVNVLIGYLLFILLALLIASGIFLAFKGAFPLAVQVHRWGGIAFFIVFLVHIIFLKGGSEG